MPEQTETQSLIVLASDRYVLGLSRLSIFACASKPEVDYSKLIKAGISSIESLTQFACLTT